MTDTDCDRCMDLLPELALGVLDGRERAVALAHVEHCLHCRTELRAMGDVADRLVHLAPSAEPPVGFETRTLQKLAAHAPTAAARPGPPRRRVAQLGIAAALVVAIGIGGWAVGRATAPSGYSTTHVTTASLIEGGAQAGEAVLSGGSQPHIILAVDSDLGDRTVRCDIVDRNGRTRSVGTYTLSHGSGSWVAPLTVPSATVASVRLVDATGRTVATASFPAT